MRGRVLLALALGAALAGCHGPGAWGLLAASGGSGRARFLAGSATVDFTPPAGYPLGGYGGGARRAEWPFYFGVGWPGQLALWGHQACHEEGPEPADLLAPSTGVHDPLTARALVLRPEGAPPVALVRIDAIGTTRELHDLVVAGVMDLGYRSDTVVLGATHTHSGAGGFMRHPFARLAAMDAFRPETERRIADACVAAVRSAHACARPARLGVGMARDRDASGQTVLAKNRRAGKRGEAAPDAIDDEALLVRVDDAASGATLAALVDYAVHPTILGTDNLAFSADLAGGVERALSARLGGAPVLFWQGAEGDVGPRRPDPAALTSVTGVTPGSAIVTDDSPAASVALAHARIAAQGVAFADLMAPALLALATHDEVRLRTAVGDVDLGEPFTFLALGRDRFVDAYDSPARWPMELFTLPVNAVLWTLGLCNAHVALTWDLALGLVVDLAPLLERTVTRVGGVRLEVGGDDVALLAVPGEPTHDVGLAIKATARRRGATRAAVLGLTFDHVGYVASEAVYREGGYEAQSTLFGVDTAAKLEAALDRVMDVLGYDPR